MPKQSVLCASSFAANSKLITLHITRLLQNAKTKVVLANSGSIRKAQKYISFKLGNKQFYMTFEVVHDLHYPRREDLGYRRSDVRETVSVCNWRTKSCNDGNVLKLIDLKNVLNSNFDENNVDFVAVIDELRSSANFTDELLKQQSVVRAQLLMQFEDLFYGRTSFVIPHKATKKRKSKKTEVSTHSTDQENSLQEREVQSGV